MKQFFLRSSLALACLASLASCGGSDEDIQVGISIEGVNRAGLSLKLNDNPPHEIGTSGFYVFPELISADSDYTISVIGRPSNVSADTPCTLVNGKGSVNTVSPRGIKLTCIIQTFTLGGSITGLGNSSGLVLINGNIQKTIDPGATQFTMTSTVNGVEQGKVPAEAPYGVLVLQSPTDKTCTVDGSTGVGTMPAANVNSIGITCVPKAT